MELGLVGSFSLILGADLQSQSVIVADVDLLTVAEGRHGDTNDRQCFIKEQFTFLK